MPVILEMSTGDKHMLDRQYDIERVVKALDEKRGTTMFVEFQNDATPSRRIYVDPNHVIAIKHDGYNY